MTIINSMLAALVGLGMFSMFWNLFTWGQIEKEYIILGIGMYIGMTLGATISGANHIGSFPLWIAGGIVILVVKSHRANTHPALWRPWK